MSKQEMKIIFLLTQYRWVIPVLTELHRGKGAKFVTLSTRLSVSKDALRRTLSHAAELGWVMRNPGHGHPLRPEYVLTAAGKNPALWCARVYQVMLRLGVTEIALRKWSVPIAVGLGEGQQRFNQIRSIFPQLTARALASALKDMQAVNLVVRKVMPSYPPTTFYSLTANGRALIV